MIVIIDYGIGNPGSLKNMLTKMGADVVISSGIEDIERAEKLILPGVGAFDAGIEKLNNLGYLPALNKKVRHDKTPILGICLGMQLFSKRSEEGVLDGFGWIDAETIKFKIGANPDKLRIPHMGWNEVIPVHYDSIFKGLENQARFYFVHSYYLSCNNEKDIIGRAFYGHDFAAAIQKENIMGTQFHPEKSHRYGMKVLENFVRYF